MNENELFQWAAQILIRETRSNLYGTVSFKFENGKITMTRIEKTEKPVIDNEPIKG